MKKSKSKIGYWLLGILILFVAIYFLWAPAGKLTPASTPARTEKAPNSSFVKEGELTFLSNGSVVTKIEIEIAENETERIKGLMYRSSLPELAGMLFIFEKAQPHSFWMKNTSIPLDIMYLDQDKKIISIHKHTTPFSEEGIPSLGDAQYVLEVNAGFTDRFAIKVGDQINFQ